MLVEHTALGQAFKLVVGKMEGKWAACNQLQAPVHFGSVTLSKFLTFSVSLSQLQRGLSDTIYVTILCQVHEERSYQWRFSERTEGGRLTLLPGVSSAESWGGWQAQEQRHNQHPETPPNTRTGQPPTTMSLLPPQPWPPPPPPPNLPLIRQFLMDWFIIPFGENQNYN